MSFWQNGGENVVLCTSESKRLEPLVPNSPCPIRRQNCLPETDLRVRQDGRTLLSPKPGHLQRQLRPLPQQAVLRAHPALLRLRSPIPSAGCCSLGPGEPGRQRPSLWTAPFLQIHPSLRALTLRLDHHWPPRSQPPRRKGHGPEPFSTQKTL